MVKSAEVPRAAPEQVMVTPLSSTAQPGVPLVSTTRAGPPDPLAPPPPPELEPEPPEATENPTTLPSAFVSAVIVTGCPFA